MARKWRNNKYGNGLIDNLKNTYSTFKGKLGDLNEYLKAKRFAHNLITNEIGWHNPIRAISQGYNINKRLQNSILNGPLQYLASKGYGRKRKKGMGNINFLRGNEQPINILQQKRKRKKRRNK